MGVRGELRLALEVPAAAQCTSVHTARLSAKNYPLAQVQVHLPNSNRHGDPLQGGHLGQEAETQAINHSSSPVPGPRMLSRLSPPA